jgi:CheY-like chemotaxis protein
MSPHKVTIVIADDNRDTAQALSRLLQLSGYHVAAAANNGAEALAAIQRERPMVALLDIGMPGMSGLEVALRLRADPSRPYLVAITGWGTEKDKRVALEAGFDEHLCKPVQWEQIAAVLARATEK